MASVTIGLRIGLALLILAVVGGCGGGGGGGNGGKVRISEYVLCQGEASASTAGLTVFVAELVVGAMLSGDAESPSYHIAASFLTDAQR
jgi:hypothetical protein